jgi:hypothetical protein
MKPRRQQNDMKRRIVLLGTAVLTMAPAFVMAQGTAGTAGFSGTVPTVFTITDTSNASLAGGASAWDFSRNMTIGKTGMILAMDTDNRGEAVRLQYPAPSGTDGIAGALLALPKDLLILATMNTADRSLALVDFAIRRRFRFVDLLPSEGVLREYYADDELAVEKVLALFRQITGLVLDPRLRIGHSYFLSPLGTTWPSALANRIAYEVMPLLREYYAEGHLLGASKIILPDGIAIEIGEDSDLRDTAGRDKIKHYLDG